MKNIRTQDLKKILLLAFPLVICIALIYLPTWQWMYHRWMSEDSYSSHGFLIPLISGWILWQERKKLKDKNLDGSWWGILLLCFGLALHSLSGLARVHFTSGVSLIFTIGGLFLLLLGKNGMKWAWFGIFYLIFMVPFPLVLVSYFTLQLKLMASEVATRMMEFMGYTLIREGSIIYFFQENLPPTKLIVGDVCSGLRSIISLLALGVPFVYFIKASWWRRLVMFVSLFPVAFICNVARVISLGLATYYWGHQIIESFLHDFLGIMLFVCDLLILWGIYLLLIEPSHKVKMEKEDKTDEEFSLQVQIKKSFCFKYGVSILLMACISVITSLYFYKELPVEKTNMLQSFTKEIGKWRVTNDFKIDYRTIQILETNNLITRHYQTENKLPVLLSIVASKNSNRKIAHPPEICMKGIGWEMMKRKIITFGKNKDKQAVYMVMFTGKQKRAILYWYKFKDKFTADYYSHQTNVLLNFLSAYKKGGLALIRLSVPIVKSEKQSLDYLKDFAEDLYPSLKKHLP